MFLKINKLLLILCVWCFLFLAFDISFAFEVERYFPHKLGNKWEYYYRINAEPESEDSFIFQIVSSKGNKFILHKDPHGDNHYFFDQQGLKLSRNIIDSDSMDYAVYSPPLVIIPADIDLFEEITYSGTIKSYNKLGQFKDIGQYTIKIKFEAKEEISVPAGYFANCLKFSYSRRFEMSDDFCLTELETIWYAPQVGRIKYISSQFFTGEGSESKSEEFYEETSLKRAIINNKEIGE